MTMLAVGGVAVALLIALVWVFARMRREDRKQEQAFDEALRHYARRYPGRWPL